MVGAATRAQPTRDLESSRPPRVRFESARPNRRADQN